MQQTEQVNIVVNGEGRRVPDGLNVMELLAFLDVVADRVAVELDRNIVRRAEWSSTIVADGSRLEIVQFVGGG
jgi:thiamine biosynthesis protein ThiS